MGISIMITLKETLKSMLKDGEIEKLVKSSKKQEKLNIKKFYNAIKDFEDGDWDKIPEMLLIQAIKSYTLWQDIYCYMVMLDGSQSTKEA